MLQKVCLAVTSTKNNFFVQLFSHKTFQKWLGSRPKTETWANTSIS